jgi:hypothetical protein
MLYQQIWAAAPQHHDLEQPSAGIPEDVGLRLNIAHLGKSHELLTVAKALSG